ncbi:hypothetical protein D9613_008387 [Agrocybe pediades]|uniref:Glycosyltransferase 61 catalytic domain-containing protein n=1 Tax=Agrocybe pediades TaxID=84607 RepID=A0A8H4VQN3_9AGAR|nr:hypothetical protein D9613_008387 [Agrocybe pediades]
MLTRRQQFTLFLIVTSFILLLYNTRGSEVIERAYSPWRSYPPSRLTGNFPLLQEKSQQIPILETTLSGNLAPVTGFTMFDRLYVKNGTIFVVSSIPAVFPDPKLILARPLDVGHGDSVDPTPKELQVVTPEQAKFMLDNRATVIGGMSFILYDTAQFMGHYYHWWGELILGAMRVYSSLALVPEIETPLPTPARFLLPNIMNHDWRDPAGVNGPLMRAAFPEASIERMDLWEDIIDLNSTFVFERAMIVSRPAAHRHPLASVWYKMISSTMNATVPPFFWEPLRKRLITNTIGYVPVLNNAGVVVSPPNSLAPVVTYVSRQNHGRSLLPSDHEKLVEALRGLEEEGICVVNVVAMETMTFTDQIETAARSTIMLGIHGNGLTHQLWMPSGPRSTVIEIYFPKAYAHDYEILARNMGHKHYAVWNDTTLTYPAGQWYHGVEWGNRTDFNGFSIPVHGPTVAAVIRERLTEPLP